MFTVWNVPHEKHSIDYQRIVQEFPPLGSRFTERGGYFTPDNICISRTMRVSVMAIKNEYAKERNEQNERTTRLPQATVTVQPMPLIPNQYLEEPLDVRRRPRILQERPPTPYVPNNEHEFWEPPLNTSDPDYVPRRPISMRQGPDVPQTQQSRIGRSNGHGTSRGKNRASQRSGN